jgi:hypothetical protein
MSTHIHEPEGHYSQWSKPDEKRQIVTDVAHAWNMKKIEWKGGFQANGGWRVGEMLVEGLML